MVNAAPPSLARAGNQSEMVNAAICREDFAEAFGDMQERLSSRRVKPRELVNRTACKTSPMDNPHRRAPRPSYQKLLWHCLMGTALGVLCAGLLLDVPGSVAETLSAAPASKILRFLLSTGLLFGLGATLTGAMFLYHDRP